MANVFIGLSALRASQYGLNVISGNIANANTPGYHKQNVHLSPLQPNTLRNMQIGSGVTVNYIERVRSQVTESSLTGAISDASNVDQMLNVERQLEAIFQPGAGSLAEQMDSLFAELTQLSSSPTESTQRSAVIEEAARLAESFRRVSSSMNDLKSSVRYQIGQEVTHVNAQLDQLATLSIEIRRLTYTSTPNAELDRRDQLINDIAQTVGIRRHDFHDGAISLSFGATTIQQGSQPIELSTLDLENGQIGIAIDEADFTTSIESGALPALIDLHNNVIPEFQNRLDELASELVRQFDSLHAQGIGSSGSFSRLESSRSVDDVGIPLQDAGAAFPVTAGELVFSVISPDGSRTTETISIDPETQSLSDIAASISGIDNLEAVVNTQTRSLQILSVPGYQFDFTGSLETYPAGSALTGTSVPELSGAYTGDVNQDLTFVIDGSGDVGITPDLTVSVLDASGNLIDRLNIGKGYETGTPIEVMEGVNITFQPGTVSAGETFDTPLVRNPDSTGILAALGLNSFFEGHDAWTIDVSDRVLSDNGSFATGYSGEAADTSNLLQMIDLQHARQMSGTSLSFSDFLNETTADIGVRVQTNTQLSISINGLKTRLEQERDSVSGVDLNEELVYLQQFQTSYEAAVQVLQTSEQMFDELLAAMR
ncbi:MAG: flagellar hook-associated protein FlgK [Planctomycetota bacterium]